MRCHYAEEKHQCNQTWCWNVERQAVGSVRSVRRHFTIKLCGPFGLRHPSALCDLSDPLWFFCLGFCGGKAESWQPKASLFTMSKDAESQIYRFHSSVFDEFHDFHGHQGSDRSDLPNMKSWPLETPAAFGNTQEGSTDRSTSKKCSSTHCRNFLRIWMWWKLQSLIALPCIFFSSVIYSDALMVPPCHQEHQMTERPAGVPTPEP